MLGPRLARRIVVPVLLLIAALFVVLGFAAVRIAEGRVAAELEANADRVARTLDQLRVPVEHRPEILPPLAALVDCELVVGDYCTREDWDRAKVARVTAGRFEIDGRIFRVLERSSGSGPDRYYLLTDEAHITGRRRDVLLPVIAAGAIGLLIAAILGIAVARTIARPVSRLAEQTRRFAEGSQEQPPPPDAPGEIGELQVAFARMVGAIRESEERLRESERFAALGRLAGGIAHELRNPLTAIRMAVETSATADEAGRDEARTIALSEIARLDRTLRELLDYVRPRKPAIEPVAARELLEDVRTLLGPQCEHLKVRLETELEGEPVFLADRDRLKQALLNLVLNGAQAQPHGGVVRLRAAPGVLEVQDDGPGISDEVRDRIFQPFVTTKSAGIGLGLAVVQQVVEEHGFALEVRSSETGTSFLLRCAE